MVLPLGIGMESFSSRVTITILSKFSSRSNFIRALTSLSLVSASLRVTHDRTQILQQRGFCTCKENTQKTIVNEIMLLYSLALDKF